MTKYAYYNSQLGYFKIGYNDDFVCLISFSFDKFDDQLTTRNEPTFFTDKVWKQIYEFLKGRRQIFDFKISFKNNGTIFQQIVWNELLKIPYGKYKTYKEIAVAIKKPKAYRAVGSAIGKNPIILVVPCHRVVSSNNKIGGYVHGVELKSRILTIENNDFLKK